MLVLLAQLSTSLLLSPSLVSHHRSAGRLSIGSRTPPILACDEATRDSEESIVERNARRERQVRALEDSVGFPEAIVDSQEYKVAFKTTAGSFNVTLDRALSPNGVDRFVELVKVQTLIDGTQFSAQ